MSIASLDDWTPQELELYGLRSATDGGMLFCGVTEEAFAINGVTYKWPIGSRLKWNLDFSRLGNLGDQDLKQAYSDALAEIEMAQGGLTFEYTANPRVANILCVVKRLDGPSGVLADMQIPVGNPRADSTQLGGRFDDAEAWVIAKNPGRNQIDFYRVALHESLHAMGLGHAPVDRSNPCLIEPMYSQTIRNLQPRDKSELVRRYGERREVPAPAPDEPVGDSVGVELIIRHMGKQVKFTGSKALSSSQNLTTDFDLQ